MSKEFNLSDKKFLTKGWKQEIYLKEDVKEFIRRLKEEINTNDDFDVLYIIDKLAGDELI